MRCIRRRLEICYIGLALTQTKKLRPSRTAVDNGLHNYGGWFFFVGEMITAGEYMSVVIESPYFGYFFTRVGPFPKEFRDVPSLAVASKRTSDGC